MWNVTVPVIFTKEWKFGQVKNIYVTQNRKLLWKSVIWDIRLRYLADKLFGSLISFESQTAGKNGI